MDHQKTVGKTRILVAPLDWGLGHATRCIPIIRELMVQGAEPWLAGEGAQKELLSAEFPHLPFLDLPGYRIKYAKTARGLAWKMIGQLSKMRKAIREEHQWLKKKNKEIGFDAVISDNRYGLYNEKISSVIITHQLRVKSPWGKWTEEILQKRNYNYINRFTECWVPDKEGTDSLAGALSHPVNKPGIPVHYIGWLSRFMKKNIAVKPGQLMIILSGPEPQRTLLENKLIDGISHYSGHADILRGLPGNSSLIPSTNMIFFYNHLPSNEAGIKMEEAEYIIARSGYSSIMDALKLQKKCIFIPTPGQTEQEWLARSLKEKGVALSISQDKFSLSETLEEAKNFSFHLPAFDNTDELKKNVRRFLSAMPSENQRTRIPYSPP